MQHPSCHNISHGLHPSVSTSIPYIMNLTCTTHAQNQVLVCFTFYFYFTYIFLFLFLRLEKVKLKCIRSQAKVVGTVTTVAGAMIMTLVKGPVLELLWNKGRSTHELKTGGIDLNHSIKGALMITTGCFSWACFMVLQVRMIHLKWVINDVVKDHNNLLLYF